MSGRIKGLLVEPGGEREVVCEWPYVAFSLYLKKKGKNVISSFPWTLFSIDAVGFCSLCVVCHAQIANCRFCASSASTMWAAF